MTEEAQNKKGKTPRVTPDFGVDLTAVDGVVLHQRAHKGEFATQIFGIPLEVKNKYIVKAMPPGAKVASSNTSPDLWKPTFEEIQALPDLFVMKEESECRTRCMFTCCGCRALRPLDVKVLVDDVEKMRISKPFKCGGWIGCPFEMTLRDGETGAEIGHVKENFSSYCSKCFEGCCCCSSYHNVYSPVETNAPGAITMDRSSGGHGGQQQPKYELKLHLCCFQGNSNNCCGATCFNYNAMFDLRDPGNNNKVIANVQKLYAPATDTTCAAFGRMCGGFDTFAIGFPEGSTQNDRMLILTAVMQAEFAIFETDQN